ncbi:hypothetical protein HZB00_01230 [Candidatus Woesearchaeota archaeon]|nr:hypothetical protein [Candidatus Woesearchaeota archaeon]
MSEQVKNQVWDDYRKLQQEVSSFKAKAREISEKKEFWFQKKESLKKDLKDLIQKIKEIKTANDAKNGEIAQLKSQRYQQNSEVKSLIKKVKKLNQEKADVLKRFNGRIEPNKIHERINALEKQVEIETSYDREKKLMGEIKRLKKVYEESSEASKVIGDAQQISKEITESKKKADEFHLRVREMTKDSNYTVFMHMSRQITELKRAQEEAFQIFIEHKNEYVKIQQSLNERLQAMDQLKQIVQKDRELVKLEQDQRKQEILAKKTKEVEEKIKNKKKLTTEDLLAFQRSADD